MASLSAPLTWQSWVRKWGDWATWTRNVPSTRATDPRTRVAPENHQKQIQKVQTATKIVSQ